MTDERTPSEPQPPDPNAVPGEPPPPLAPLVGSASAGAAARPADETTAQPTSSWEQPTAPPPTAPPPTAPPPIQPPAEQPPVAWAPPPPAAAPAAGGVTGLAKAAGVLLIIGGVLGGLAGLAVAVFGSAVVQMVEDMGAIPNIEGVDPVAFITGFIVFFGILILVYSMLYLIGGIGIVRSRDWGRVLGIIVGIISGLVWLGSVTTPDQPGAQESIVGSLIAFGIHAYILVALIFFWRRKPA